MTLSRNLYITYSNQRARELQHGTLTRPFDKVVTLDGLILEVFEKRHFKYLIDRDLGASIFYHIIQKEKIDYFDYLDAEAQSLELMFDFLVRCRRNDVALEVLLEGEKLEAMGRIDVAYEAYKRTHRLADLSDVESRVLEVWDEDLFNHFETVYVDDFKVGQIDFRASKKQEKLLTKLSQYPKIPKETSSKAPARIVKPFREVFDAIDEVRTALKITRKLLEEGEEAEQILVVASDISEYALPYRLFLDEYGLEGYTSVGTPLSSYHLHDDPRVQQAKRQFEQEAERMAALYKRLGLSFGTQERERLKASVKILDEKIGIEMTEPNQLVGLNRSYRHIIFIGTDINHFPPQAKDTFLYTYEDALQYLGANDYFLSSQTQLNELKRLADTLYIVTATHSDKRELAPSILLDGKFDDTIDIDDIKSISELALENKTIKPDSRTQAYYESLLSEDFTVYDGIGVEGVEARYLSASQINRYLACPLSYLYSNKLSMKAPRQSEEGFDVMEQGSLMHKCFELFGRKIKSEKITDTDRDRLYDLMYNISIDAYHDPKIAEDRGEENIHHRLFLSSLQAALKDEREKGLLAKFVDYYIGHAKEFEYFQNTEFEKEFLLDDVLRPYERQSDDDKNHFIRGFIDRFDDLEGQINVIDYKSKKIGSKGGKHKKTQEKIDALEDVQLALYLLYARQKYPEKKLYASLLSFKGESPAAHFGELSGEAFDEAYMTKLKKIVFGTKAKIEAGDFHFDNSDEDACGWCDYKRICHQGVLEKAVLMQSEGNNISKNDTIKV